MRSNEAAVNLNKLWKDENRKLEYTNKFVLSVKLEKLKKKMIALLKLVKLCNKEVTRLGKELEKSK